MRESTALLWRHLRRVYWERSPSAYYYASPVCFSATLALRSNPSDAILQVHASFVLGQCISGLRVQEYHCR